MIKIAVLGYGVVGSGVVELITKNQENIQKNALQNIEVKRILVRKKLDIIDNKYKFTNNFNDILNDNEISIVVEAMGGICPAFDYVKALLNNGKSVVTSNKELVSKKGAELIKIANEKGISFLFEASVGGG
ncbi:MAG: homoserine dehydrogenase, partial [Oscillospiraceae bacterium]